MEKNIDTGNWKKLTDVEHVLERPQIYVGSTRLEERYALYYDTTEKAFKQRDLQIVPGVLTMFNELINNAFDEYIRSHQENKQHKVTEIDVTINRKENSFTVRDNGGIPVVKHEEYNEWLPSMLFGSLRSGSNYTNERGSVSGTNGVGASLVNVFSDQFTVTTADAINEFSQTWNGVLGGKLNESPHTIKKSKKHFTEIYAKLNFSRFEVDSLTQDLTDLLLMRCIEIAASGAHQKHPLKVNVTIIDNDEVYNESFKFKHFWQFKEMFPSSSDFWGEDNARFKFELGPSESGRFESIALVNSIRCDEGTHVDELLWHFINPIRLYMAKKHKVDVKPQQIRNCIRLYSWWMIDAPEFATQTKEKLVTPHQDFGFDIFVTDKFIKSIIDSNKLMQALIDDVKAKEVIAKRKELRQLDKSIASKSNKRLYVDKLIDASERYDRHACTLYIVEGDSAGTGFRNARNARYHGLFKLRGKFTNVFYSDIKHLATRRSKRGEESELLRLMKSAGLQFGQPAAYYDKKTDTWSLNENLRFGRICILTDADVDGSSIACQLVLMFKKFWPELIDSGILHRILTPIVIVKNKGNVVKRIYSLNEFKEFEQSTSKEELNKLSFEYTKGLGRLSNAEWKLAVNEPVYQIIKSDDNDYDWQMLYGWFGDNPDYRKLLIAGEIDEFLKFV